MRLPALLAVATVAAAPAAAQVPAVVADIPPIHSIAAKVMGELGTPTLLVQPGASPHSYALRPSEARALQDADIILWTSEGLTPWLSAPLGAVADAEIVELLDVDGTTRLDYREGATFAAGDEHDDHVHGDDHGHEQEHDDAHHEEGHDHGGHDRADDHAHGHTGTDPHAWLDPENAKLWTRHIAEMLSAADPANAETYAANAEAAVADLDALSESIAAQLEPLSPGAFVVFHDAYHYFENRFDVPAAGAISLSDASDPSPARIAEIRATVERLDVACVFSEPQFNPGLVESVFGDSGVTTAVLDPLGADLEIGPDLYPTLIRRMSGRLADCAG